MAEIIQAIMPGAFPFPRVFREEDNARRRSRPKTEFGQWLADKPVNSNEDVLAPPLLSMEDELMLAKLRELARPFTPATTAPSPVASPQNPYAAAAQQTVADERQYELPFVSAAPAPALGETLNRKI